MRILSTGDLHIEQGPRFEDQCVVLDRIVEIAAEQAVDIVILTGDYYGRTVPYHTSAVERSAMSRFVAGLAAHAPVLMIYGNHDTPQELDPFSAIRGVRVVSKPRTVRLDYMPGRPECEVHCLPFPTVASMRTPGDNVPRSPEDRAQWLRACTADALAGFGLRASQRAPGAVHVFAGHLSVNGSDVGGGEVFSGSEITVGADAIDAMGCDVALLGHYHARQHIGLTGLYNGSPHRVSFADTGPKSVTVVDVGPEGSAIQFHDTGARELITQRWRIRSRGKYSIERVGNVEGAEVRIIVEAPHTHRAIAEAVRDRERAAELDRGAHRVTTELRIQPVERVRAPDLLGAKTMADRLRAYWGTLDDPPSEQAQSDALDLLAELESKKVSPTA